VPGDRGPGSPAGRPPKADVPFQSNFNFGVGPGDDFQYVLNVQPVVPFRLTEGWNLITRTIIPLIDQPELAPGVSDVGADLVAGLTGALVSR